MKCLDMGMGATDRCQQRGTAGPHHLCWTGHRVGQQNMSQGQSIHKMPKSLANNIITKHPPGQFEDSHFPSIGHVSLGSWRKHVLKGQDVWKS